MKPISEKMYNQIKLLTVTGMVALALLQEPKPANAQQPQCPIWITGDSMWIDQSEEDTDPQPCVSVRSVTWGVVPAIERRTVADYPHKPVPGRKTKGFSRIERISTSFSTGCVNGIRSITYGIYQITYNSTTGAYADSYIDGTKLEKCK